MEPISEALRLIQRQALLRANSSVVQNFPITIERELFHNGAQLTRFPASVDAILQSASDLHRPIDDLTVRDVEKWAIQTGLLVGDLATRKSCGKS